MGATLSAYPNAIQSLLKVCSTSHMILVIFLIADVIYVKSLHQVHSTAGANRPSCGATPAPGNH